MKQNSYFLAIISLLLATTLGCEFNTFGTANSNQGDNEYFEEPISGRSKKYSAALETSNRFVELFTAGQIADVRNLFDPRLQNAVSEEQLQLMHSKVLQDFGAYVEHKPMQWGFSTNSKLENIVISIKIVVHQGSETFYVLNFQDDGLYDSILGVNIIPKSQGVSVSDAANRAYGMS